MLDSVKSLGRAIIPKPLFRAAQPFYHGLMAKIAAAYYHHPSDRLVVIGVTGTAGKSTTVMMLAEILNGAGKKTGYITTVGFGDGSTQTLNKHGLSMPGGWMIQNGLDQMVRAGCSYAIIECTSEGLAQNRHRGIEFQGALFTNLSPAHLDSHGSFENYRAAKRKLFRSVTKSGVIGVNLDDPNRENFLNFPVARKFGISMRADTEKPDIKIYQAKDITVGEHIQFVVEDIAVSLNMLGTFNILNALLAIGMADQLGVPLSDSAESLAQFGQVAGRMETFTAKSGATIIVDYAPEPAAMEASLRAAIMLPHTRLIHVFGATGGHRDVAKRFEFGKISAGLADTIIITNDDVYDSDPEEIARNITEGIKQSSKQPEVQTILDRREAIAAAMTMAGPNDVVLITGKGSEQFLVLPENKRVEWDDREVVKKLL